MALASHGADHAHHDTNQIRTVISEVSKNVSDSNGNFKSWVVKTCWQELSLNGVVYRRFLGETHCLYQRGILGQPRSTPTFMSHGRSPMLVTPPRDIVVRLSSPIVQLQHSLKPGVVEHRLERIVQMLIAIGLSDALELPEGSNKEPKPRQPEVIREKPAISSRLLSLLANAINRPGNETGQEEVRRALPCPVVKEDKLLPSADKLAQSVKPELLQLIDELTKQFITEPSVQHKAVIDEPNVAPLPIKPSTDRPSTQQSVRHGHGVMDKHLTNTQNHSDSQKMIHKPVSVTSANKPGVHHQAAPVAASVNVNLPAVSLLSNILASAMPAAMSPIPIAESGQKQLPPIILPNIGHGAGNRSERKKSKKERDEEEEEERERSRNPFLFDDDDPLDSDEDEE